MLKSLEEISTGPREPFDFILKISDKMFIFKKPMFNLKLYGPSRINTRLSIYGTTLYAPNARVIPLSTL